MNAKLLLIALVCMVAFASAEKCHPQCKWQCDDPSCPAVCHPVCERPRCQMQCEETTCAKCTIHCEKPICSVRCPRDLCEDKDCPKCETVCSPAACHTTCKAPEPSCSPICEETSCQWKCKKPQTCPKPKCELQCEKAKCGSTEQGKGNCCPCNNKNVGAAMQQANKNEGGASSSKPSFIEVMHNMRHHQQSGRTMCCPCADTDLVV